MKQTVRRVILVEENLPTQEGHWKNYMEGLEKGFSSYGFIVECLGSGFGQLTRGLQIRSVFRNSYWKQPYRNFPYLVRFLKKILHPWIWSEDFQAWSKRFKQANDIIFAPNQRPMHLLAWGLWLSKNPLGGLSKIVIGMNYFGNGDRGHVSFLDELHLKMAKLLLMRVVSQDRVIFFSENEVARTWLQQKTGFKFHLMPHNVDATFGASCDLTMSGNNSILFVALGYARYDKGSDLLLKAIELYLRKSYSASNCQFWLQWGSEVPRSEFCDNHPQVTFYDDLLDAPVISQILRRADCALMPYRNNAYHGRLSRAAIDAVANGCPVIYPHGSSIGEIVGSYGVGVCFENEQLYSLVSAIEDVILNHASLKKAAVEKAYQANIYYSPENHTRVILETINQFK